MSLQKITWPPPYLKQKQNLYNVFEHIHLLTHTVAQTAKSLNSEE